MTDSSADEPALDRYLRPTRYLDADHPDIRALAGELRRSTDEEAAIALFGWVRDEVRYDPFAAAAGEASFQASATLARGRGYCVQKAVLLAALGRAAGVPTRLGFADVRNHQTPENLLRMMGGNNLYVYHGYTEFHLGGRWVKATPAFDRGAATKAGVLPVELDGVSDALLHPVDPRGDPYIEYVRERGSFDDLPFDEIRAAMIAAYDLGRFMR